MKISDLKDKTAIEELVVRIKKVNEPRDTRVGQVQDADVEDDTGSASLTLWTNEVGRFTEGDQVKISNGWAKMYNGQLQVSAGRYGALEKVDATDAVEKVEIEETVEE
ncbi:hypothetical protein ACFLRF_01415 [Candidatus Altiarchaeota archaeon]